MKVILIDPDAVLDYFVEWERWLAGDEIDVSSWIIAPDTLNRLQEIKTATRATIWLSGAEAGTVYLVTNHVKTLAGREDDRSFKLVGRDR